MKYYKRHLCNKCRQLVVARVTFDQLISPSRLVKIECPTCHNTETKILSPEEYRRVIEERPDLKLVKGG